MEAVNGLRDDYGTTLDHSATLEPEPPIDSRKSLRPRETTRLGVKLGLGFLCVGTPTPAATGFGTNVVVRRRRANSRRLWPGGHLQALPAGAATDGSGGVVLYSPPLGSQCRLPVFSDDALGPGTGCNDPLHVGGPPPTKLTTERLVGPEGPSWTISRRASPLPEPSHPP